jgi:hypothetical protein
MVSSEVQRTLVKSPPELWAELSDPAALARHLGELGEIRITNTKPEERIEWEADRITGTVSIKASGWGTKVTLSVARESDAPAPEPADAADAATSAEAEPIVETHPMPEPEPKPELKPEPAVQPRRGFFARLFRRAPQPEPAVAHEPVAIAAPEPELEPEPVATIEPEPPADEGPVTAAAEEPTEPPADIAGELKAAEEVAAEEVTAVLTAVLDRLGAAHHRPFSRA